MDMLRDTYCEEAVARAMALENNDLFRAVDCALRLYNEATGACLDYADLLAAILTDVVVPALPANMCVVESIVYTGDGGVAHVINLVDTVMDVKGIIITSRVTADGSTSYFTFCSDVIVDDNASGMTISGTNAPTTAHEGRTNEVIGLGVGTFTVDDDGGDNHPNKNGVVYNALVWGTH